MKADSGLPSIVEASAAFGVRDADELEPGLLVLAGGLHADRASLTRGEQLGRQALLVRGAEREGEAARRIRDDGLGFRPERRQAGFLGIDRAGDDHRALRIGNPAGDPDRRGDLVDGHLRGECGGEEQACQTENPQASAGHRVPPWGCDPVRVRPRRWTTWTDAVSECKPSSWICKCLAIAWRSQGATPYPVLPGMRHQVAGGWPGFNRGRRPTRHRSRADAHHSIGAWPWKSPVMR